MFRLDATKNIGIGHLMRCFSLSEELIKKGNTCFFLSNIDSDKIKNKIENSKIKLNKITTSPESKNDIKYLLDFSEKNDISWIITDHYKIDDTYIKNIKKAGFKVLSIDDASQIYYSSDIVVNQNIGAEKLKFRSNKKTNFLLGPKYIMIRDELLKREDKITRKNVKKILVTLGGSTNNELIFKVIKLLDEALKGYDVEVIFVLGPLDEKSEKFVSDIRKECTLNIKFVHSPKNMADQYLNSDIAISAGGSSCYELAYFGIPNLIITIADNQLEVAKELHNKDIGIYVGKKEDFSSDDFKNSLLKLINNSDIRKNMQENGIDLVDGKGKKRILKVMDSYKN